MTPPQGQFQHFQTDRYILLLAKFRESGDEKAGPPFHLDPHKVTSDWFTKETGYRLIHHEPSLYPISNPDMRQQCFLLQKTSP
eukprot:g48092.t1